MAENSTNPGRNNTGLALIVGGLVVLVAVIAWFVFMRGALEPETRQVDINVDLPTVQAPATPAPPAD